jgi:ABC-type amino acid transport substrate-binding protein
MMGVMSITEERKQFLNFIGPHYFEQIRVLISENQNYEITKHEDLFNLPGKIAVIRGTYLGEKMMQMLENEKFKKRTILASTSNSPSIFEKLRLGRISAFIDTEMPGILKADAVKGLKFHSFIVNAEPVYFGVSKKSVDQPMLDKLQAAVERIRKRGEFEKILKKYE